MSKFPQVFDAVRPVFTAHNFRKSGNTFYRVSDNRLVVFRFRGHSAGGVFYVDYGERPFDVANKGKALSSSDLKGTYSQHHIRLFESAGDWIYEMGNVERDILVRKIEEQLNSSNGAGSVAAPR